MTITNEKIYIKPFYTLDELASDRYNLASTQTIRKWIKEGKLNAVKRGKRYYITHEALMEFLKD